MSAATQPVPAARHSLSNDISAAAVTTGAVLIPDTVGPGDDATPDRTGRFDGVAGTGLDAVERVVWPFGDDWPVAGSGFLPTATAPV
jgi:hypothetical protein